MQRIGDIAPFGLRMPDDVRAFIEAAAKKNLRSLNSEIVLALKEKMERQPDARGQGDHP